MTLRLRFTLRSHISLQIIFFVIHLIVVKLFVVPFMNKNMPGWYYEWEYDWDSQLQLRRFFAIAKYFAIVQTLWLQSWNCLWLFLFTSIFSLAITTLLAIVNFVYEWYYELNNYLRKRLRLQTWLIRILITFNLWMELQSQILTSHLLYDHNFIMITTFI